MNLDEALPGFIAESGDLLREMEAGLLECSFGSVNPETINLIFRSAHTIKGSAGLFGLDEIVHFVHAVETLLDRVRREELRLDESLTELLLRCKDHIATLVSRVVTPEAGHDAEVGAASDELVDALNLACKGGALAGEEPLGARARPETAAPRKEASDSLTSWQIVVRFGPDVLTSGMDPLGFIRYLGKLGELVDVTVLEDQLPVPPEFQPESCYLGFEMELRTEADQARIESTFEFVKDDCNLTIRRKIAAPAEPTRRSAGPAPEATAPSSIRVDANKLDHLITRIGELIIAAAGTNLIARRNGSRELEEATSALSGLVEQVRESALQLRMVRIGGTFSRFQRVVHDLSRELGKEIGLVVHGEDTELDKTVVERIADPLTHLVRNAIDHGIEPVAVRLERGKPAAGTVTLNAYHDSGSIVIEVGDDGGGLKRERILEKARERGLLESERELTDAEVFKFIFEPGFSTAASVTNLSGRGVGMDVVKRNIAELRGSVDVCSTEGVGTTVTVRLPLTLAIINGFQVAIGKSNFVLPLDSIDECIEYSAHAGHDLADLRGRVLPFIDLREVFGTSEPPSRRRSIVVVRHGAEQAGLVVDALIGEFQTVIKPLGKMFRRVDCVSGSSILGTGEVALILDVPALINKATARTRRGDLLHGIQNRRIG
ncbi:MAG TPA: chemotaxis protein CheA [Steroidobacteraceae bacterium]|jgi:two-component system chemotaxis sensor kinase CheA